MPRFKLHVTSHEGTIEVEMEDSTKPVEHLAHLALGIAEKLADVVEPPASTSN